MKKILLNIVLIILIVLVFYHLLALCGSWNHVVIYIATPVFGFSLFGLFYGWDLKDCMVFIKHHKKIISTILFVLLLFLYNIPATYNDVSNNLKYKDLIGTEYKTKQNLLVIGIDSTDKDKIVDNYELMPSINFSGPEIVSREVLQSGTKIVITKILQCTFCIPPFLEFVARPVYEQSQWLELKIVDVPDNYIFSKEVNAVRLNPKYYENIE